jgi:hypothetical protein
VDSKTAALALVHDMRQTIRQAEQQKHPKTSGGSG